MRSKRKREHKQLRTLAEWNNAGYLILSGQCALYYAESGEHRFALFGPDQVVPMRDVRHWSTVQAEALDPPPASMRQKQTKVAVDVADVSI